MPFIPFIWLFFLLGTGCQYWISFHVSLVLDILFLEKKKNIFMTTIWIEAGCWGWRCEPTSVASRLISAERKHWIFLGGVSLVLNLSRPSPPQPVHRLLVSITTRRFEQGDTVCDVRQFRPFSFDLDALSKKRSTTFHFWEIAIYLFKNFFNTLPWWYIFKVEWRKGG